jgi:GNAT superfamily N-acetyltransferase
MKLATITDPAHPDMPFFKAVYEEAFPEEERCPWERMLGFLGQPGHPFRLTGVYLDDGTPIGFAAHSEFGRYLYGIYLAFDRAHRGAGYGRRVLQSLHAQLGDRLIFGEIEHPVTPKAQRRLAFYQSLGYHVADIGFVQPSLGPGLHTVPYLIISYPDPLSHADADAIREILTTLIYRGR